MSAELALLAAGCMTPIGVKRISPQEANRDLTASVLTTGESRAHRRKSFCIASICWNATAKTQPVRLLSCIPASERAMSQTAGVESELIVPSGHSTQGEPRTIEEVRRILYEHAGLK